MGWGEGGCLHEGPGGQLQLCLSQDERDLPEITMQEIDLLMEQEGFLGPGEERPLELAPISPRKRRAEEGEKRGVGKEGPEEQLSCVALSFQKHTVVMQTQWSLPFRGSLPVLDQAAPGSC